MLQLVYLFSPSLTAVLVAMAVACITDADSGVELLSVYSYSGKSVTNHFSSQLFVLLHSKTPLGFPL